MKQRMEKERLWKKRRVGERAKVGWCWMCRPKLALAIASW